MTDVVLKPGWLEKTLKEARVVSALQNRIYGTDGKPKPSMAKLKKALAVLK